MHRTLFIVAALAWAGVACQISVSLGPEGEGTPVAPSPTPSEPTPTRPEPTPTPTGGGLVESFHDNSNGWFEGSVSLADVFIAQGALHIDNPFEEDVDNFVFSTMECCDFGKFELTVDATQVEGTDNNEIGIVFYARDSRNFFEFDYSGDGFVGLFEYVDGDDAAIVESTPVDAIRRGSVTNTVQVIVEDGQVTGYINGELVLEAQIDVPEPSPIGLGCGAFEAPKVHCAFDNLRITEL